MMLLHHAEAGGYWAQASTLPGCFTQGETIAELEKHLHELPPPPTSVPSPATGILYRPA